MTTGVDVGHAIIGYLKSIYPNSATKSEIFSKIGASGCVGESWLDTLVAGHKIQVSGKKGRFNLYRYNKPSSHQK